MKILIIHKILPLTLLCETISFAEMINFDEMKEGERPTGWIVGVTGEGASRWAVVKDDTAPTPPYVLKQSGAGRFPWCVNEDLQLEMGYVEVKFKALSGKEDQAGGLVWRWKNKNTYYVARANALEGNVSLYYLLNGRRITLKYADAPVKAGVWHTLRVEFTETTIQVLLDKKTYIHMEDTHISGGGAIGVWTKADSVTAFDNFQWGSLAL